MLAECQSTVIPARGEVVQLDTTDATGEIIATEHDVARRLGDAARPVARVVSGRRTEAPLSVQHVEVAVLPDVTLVPEFAAAAEQILSESKM